MTDVRRMQAVLADELRSLGQHIRNVTASEPPRDHSHQASQLNDPLYLTMLETLRAMVCVLDDEGGVTYVSPTADSILGRQGESLGMEHSLNWIHPDDLPLVSAFARQIREEKSAPLATWRVKHRDGHWLWLETSVMGSFRVSSGAVLTVMFSRDVTETQEALRALRDSEERFRALAENASDILIEIDGEGRVLFASPHCAEVFQFPPDSMVGQSMADSPLWASIPAEDRDAMSAGFVRSLAEQSDHFESEFRYPHQDGTLHWMHSSARSYRISDSSTRLVIMGRDVTARVQAQREVVESERRHRVVSDATRDLITECDSDGRLLYASPSMETILGFKPAELVGSLSLELTHPDDVERLTQLFFEGVKNQEPVRTGAYRARHKDGSWRWLTSTGVAYTSPDGPVLYLSVARDITEERRAEQERKRLEQHLQWTQKLESLGVMAGGIAHDFNNLLTPILGDASLALMDMPESSPAHTRLKRIQKAAHRAASLTNQMLAYAGKGPLVVELLNLSDLVTSSCELLESAVASRASLSFNAADNLPAVEGDAGQVTQVVLNLTTNAAEAIHEGQGIIVVRTGTTEIQSELTLLGDRLEAGQYVFVEVSDNGEGMDEPTRTRIFDPFYTTKFTGRGLGLASSLGIARGHGGSIEVESQPGHGTKMRLLLPVSSRRAEPSEPSTAKVSEWRATGTILVVDDDEGVRELTADTLQRAGFHVLSAADGREGVEIYRQRADEIRAVLLDRTMPVYGGEEAFAEMRRIRKDARIILVSGYSKARAVQHLPGLGLAAFIQKPFLPETLLEVLRSVLDDSAPREGTRGRG